MSAVVCPQCQSPLSQDFGVVTCSQCGAVLMVDINGDVGVDLPPIDPQTPFIELEPISLQFPEPLEPQPPAQVPPPEEPGAAFREIEDFGNQDLHSGPLDYTLRIEGLDSGELKTKLKDVLSDSRLNLNTNQVLSALAYGKLELRGLNPVKVTYIVSRLKHLPLKISWRQSAFQN